MLRSKLSSGGSKGIQFARHQKDTNIISEKALKTPVCANTEETTVISHSAAIILQFPQPHHQ